jgi:hypothetical protein
MSPPPCATATAPAPPRPRSSADEMTTRRRPPRIEASLSSSRLSALLCISFFVFFPSLLSRVGSFFLRGFFLKKGGEVALLCSLQSAPIRSVICTTTMGGDKDLFFFWSPGQNKDLM